MPETSCVKETSVHIQNKRIKQLCKHKISDFGMAFWVRRLFGTFEKWAPVALQSNMVTFNTFWHKFNHFKHYF